MRPYVMPDPELAKRLSQERRNYTDLTQLDVARRLGISESQVAKIETGRVSPAPKLVAEIEAVFSEAKRQRVRSS